MTILHWLDGFKSETPQAPAHFWKEGSSWKALSAVDLYARVESLANYLEHEGIGPGSVGLIYAYNSSGWIQADLASMLAGVASAGIYINSSDRQIHFILDHSEAALLVVDDLASYEKIFSGQDPTKIAPRLKRVIVLNSPQEEKRPTIAHSLHEAVAIGRSYALRTFGERLERLQPDDRAVLIYTSGTTGQPKAVSLSHRNLTFTAQCYGETLDDVRNGRLFSFLPLAHIAERMVNLGLGLRNRFAIYFCSNPMSIALELREVQPSVALCVPRLWDKLKEGVEKALRQMPPKRQAFIARSMELTRRHEHLRLNGERVPLWLRLRVKIADRLALSKIRKQIGIDSAVRTASGAAALSLATLDWYRGLGVNLIEAYALSETTGVLTCGLAIRDNAGSVGRPYPGIEIRLAADGEIETRGPHVFQGYFKDDLATAEILQDGWLKTGDLGQFDERGNLRIIGRKREIIKSAEGKMISPLYLEAQLMASPLIDQAIVVGSEKPFLTALLTLPDTIRIQGNKSGPTIEDPLIRADIQKHVDKINAEFASHERIKRFCILARPFSIERDEMTATMKLKRRVIEKNYQDLIDASYR